MRKVARNMYVSGQDNGKINVFLLKSNKSSYHVSKHIEFIKEILAKEEMSLNIKRVNPGTENG